MLPRNPADDATTRPCARSRSCERVSRNGTIRSAGTEQGGEGPARGRLRASAGRTSTLKQGPSQKSPSASDASVLLADILPLARPSTSMKAPLHLKLHTSCAHWRRPAGAGSWVESRSRPTPHLRELSHPV